MRTYIMFSKIDVVGGEENYVNSKVQYLQKNKWKVVVFSPKVIEIESSPWPNLNQFFNNRRVEFRYSPDLWTSKRVDKIVTWMKEVVGKVGEEIIIESSEDHLAGWGEILAKELGAKHFCFLLSESTELYHPKDFLYFKYQRRELAGIHKSSILRLFSNYREVNEDNCPVLAAANYGVVQDIKNLKIDNLKKLDWDIAYIGRYKQYVDNVVTGVMKFAMRHSEKQIHFLVLGDIKNIIIKIPKNVEVEELGFMTPIPQSFFQHVDVVIAGAGCAGLAQKAGALTIVADASTCMSSGLLGYTTMDALFSSGVVENFDVALENALVKKIWLNLPYKPLPVRSESEIEQLYGDHFKCIEQSDQTKEYFDFHKKRRKDYRLMDYAKFYMDIYTPKIFLFASKVKRILKVVINNAKK